MNLQALRKISQIRALQQGSAERALQAASRAARQADDAHELARTQHQKTESSCRNRTEEITRDLRIHAFSVQEHERLRLRKQELAEECAASLGQLRLVEAAAAEFEKKARESSQALREARKALDKIRECVARAEVTLRAQKEAAEEAEMEDFAIQAAAVQRP
jgi:hypothetical protein